MNRTPKGRFATNYGQPPKTDNEMRTNHIPAWLVNESGEKQRGCAMLTLVAVEREQKFILERLRLAFASLVESCGGDAARAADLAAEAMNSCVATEGE